MICPNCGFNNRDDAKFCRGCGKYQTVPAPVPVAAAPVPEAVLPAAPKKKTVPKTKRLRWILLTLFFLAIADSFLISGPLSTLMRRVDTKKYVLDEFSISMSPNMVRNKTDTFKMEKLQYHSYLYSANDGTRFFAAVSDVWQDDDLSFAVEYPSAVTRGLFTQYLNLNANSPHFSGDYFTFYTYVEDKRCYCTAREIIKNGRVYSFCFISPKPDTELYVSWLKTISIVSE